MSVSTLSATAEEKGSNAGPERFPVTDRSAITPAPTPAATPIALVRLPFGAISSGISGRMMGPRWNVVSVRKRAATTQTTVRPAIAKYGWRSAGAPMIDVVMPSATLVPDRPSAVCQTSDTLERFLRESALAA